MILTCDSDSSQMFFRTNVLSEIPEFFLQASRSFVYSSVTSETISSSCTGRRSLAHAILGVQMVQDGGTNLTGLHGC